MEGRPFHTRLHSLDALRGFDMFWIISGEGIFHGLSAATDHPAANWISDQLHHSSWNGFTFYDMIFPLFIFIAGIAMPLSYERILDGKNQKEKKLARTKIYNSLFRRTVILILLGMVVNGALQWQGYENTRFASVLGRIALACFFAALIYLNASLRKQILWFFLILFGYWALMILTPVPGHGQGILTPEGNLAAYVDRLFLPGKLHRKIYDPEGLLSTIPAISTALLGVFAGRFFLWSRQKWNSLRIGSCLFLSGIILLALGWTWGLVFPINKNLWTSSFVLYAGGWSVLLLGIFYLIIDVAGYKKWSQPLIWIGTNSILIYLAAHGLINFESTAQFLFGGLIAKTPGAWHPVWLWTGVAMIQLATLYFLYSRKWFLKV